MSKMLQCLKCGAFTHEDNPLVSAKVCACGGIMHVAQTDEETTMPTIIPAPDWHPLQDIFAAALKRVADPDGKGMQRHASPNIHFTQQPIMSIPRELGGSPAPLLFQAVKKIYESHRLSAEQAENELLDAIVYVGAAILLQRENRT